MKKKTNDGSERMTKPYRVFPIPARLLFVLAVVLAASCNVSKKSTKEVEVPVPFEGLIVYSVEYADRSNPGQDWSVQLGDRQYYYIKGSKYRAEFNGRTPITQIYTGSDTLYSLTKGERSVMYTDATVSPGKIIEWEIEEIADTIIGRPVHLLRIETDNSLEEHYFDPSLRVTPDAFESHNYGHWAFFTRKTGALPLKIVIDQGPVHMELVALRVERQELQDELFKVPSYPRIPVLD